MDLIIKLSKVGEKSELNAALKREAIRISVSTHIKLEGQLFETYLSGC